MKEKQTPLMRQYNQIKNSYPDTILFFRLGDFFETFNDDAVTTAKVCGITLTKRNNGAAGDCPLAGFPHHQLDAYLPKLVRAGYRVAVCDQLEDPKQSRGIVRRGVTEVVTPGVALYDKLLDSRKNNYLASIIFDDSGKTNLVGFSCLDISTAEYFAGEFPKEELLEVISTFNPAEIVISKSQKTQLAILIADLNYEPAITKLDSWVFEEDFGREGLTGHFKTNNLKGFGIENLSFGIAAAGAILYYINETQKGHLNHITSISLLNRSKYMMLDYATRRNLEITSSFSEFSKQGTLISILDKTKTPMGGRLFKKWITRPLRDLSIINFRLDAVRKLVGSPTILQSIRLSLSGISDLERLISKICTGRSTPRDIIGLKTSLNKIPEIKDILKNLNSESLNKISLKIKNLNNLINLISSALLDEPSAQLGTGNVFKDKYSEELDSYIEAKYSGKNWVSQYRDTERENSGIPSLKVGYNSVFGYYIEITKTHKNKVPERYERKQTLTNSERYTTPELKEIEEKILNAEEKISELELRLFSKLRNEISKYTREIQDNAYYIATIDCLQSFGQSAIEHNYTEPIIDKSEKIEIIDGRHPVVEQLLDIGTSFTPNDTNINTESEQIHILTGPNMSGKSCYLRQVGLIVLLGQIGSFVPAKSAKFGVVDRIFTRVGAQDNITSGESTFLVEMQEAANIMNNATRQSLILLDEIGRGTATFDGLSIAWAITEFIHSQIRAKTLFATHYHELNELESRYERIKNYKVEVIEAGDTIVFKHKVLKGASDHSFGIHVAQMAGLPNDVIDRAFVILKAFEKEDNSKTSMDTIKNKKADPSKISTPKSHQIPEQLSIFELRDDPLREQILRLDLENITPFDAMKILSEMQKKARKRKH